VTQEISQSTYSLRLDAAAPRARGASRGRPKSADSNHSLHRRQPLFDKFSSPISWFPAVVPRPDTPTNTFNRDNKLRKAEWPGNKSIELDATALLNRENLVSCPKARNPKFEIRNNIECSKSEFSKQQRPQGTKNCFEFGSFGF